MPNCWKKTSGALGLPSFMKNERAQLFWHLAWSYKNIKFSKCDSFRKNSIMRFFWPRGATTTQNGSFYILWKVNAGNFSDFTFLKLHQNKGLILANNNFLGKNLLFRFLCQQHFSIFEKSFLFAWNRTNVEV